MTNEWQAFKRDSLAVIQSVSRLHAHLAEAGVSAGPSAEGIRPPRVAPREPVGIPELFHILDVLPSLVAYLKARRATRRLMQIDSEADVQDLLFLALKPSFPDLVYEEPSRKGAAGYSIGDFRIPSLQLILEAKYVATVSDAKAKADEIAEDIWKYTSQTDCQRIVFFTYDPLLLIPDRANYVRALSASVDDFRCRGRPVEIQTVIKP